MLGNVRRHKEQYHGVCEYCHRQGQVFRSVDPDTSELGWFCLGCDKTLEKRRARAAMEAVGVST